MATTNETAAKLSALVRERLAVMGMVGEAEITLSDGNRAGVGDLVRARLNTRIDADGQSLANRDVVRIESITESAYGRLAAVRRQVSPREWSRPFFVPVAYLEQSAEPAYAGNVHVAQGRTVDRAHLVVDGIPNRSSIYVGSTRAREKNTIHVVTGAQDPAQPDRAERDAYAEAQLRRAAELRAAERPDLAKDVRLTMPARPSDRQMAPWEAILAQGLQNGEPERTALEEIQAAQDFTTHTGHLFELRQAFWQVDVVPKIDEMVRERIPAAEYERYIRDPERPAFLQALRAHEIGGRAIEDVLDSITAEPLTGLRSIAAGLHGRAGKEPPPGRGETKTWAERTPAQASAEIQAADRMADQRQAELGRQLAERPEPWALEAMGRPAVAAESAALRADWEKQAGIVGQLPGASRHHRPGAGARPGTDRAGRPRRVVPRQRPGPEAARRGGAAEGHGPGRARGAQSTRTTGPWRSRPPMCRPRSASRRASSKPLRSARTSPGHATMPRRSPRPKAQAQAAAEDLARLAVADAARREWHEAHAGQAARAEAAERELRSRGLAERIPVTDAEAAEAAAQPRETPPIDPAEHARLRAEQTARVEADRQARAEASARACPVTDAEMARYGTQQPEPEPEAEAVPEWAAVERERVRAIQAEHERRDAARAEQAARAEAGRQAEAGPGGSSRAEALAGLREDVGALSAKVDEMARQDAERAAERAEINQAAIDEPSVREPRAEPGLEPSWQPGDAQGRYEAQAEQDAEPEMEIG